MIASNVYIVCLCQRLVFYIPDVRESYGVIAMQEEVLLKVAAISWLSPYEERILEAIKEEGDVKSAAFELKIQPSTIYSVVSHIRLKLVKSQNTVNQMNTVKKKSHALRRLLVPIQRVSIPASEAEGSDAEDSEGLLQLEKERLRYQ